MRRQLLSTLLGAAALLAFNPVMAADHIDSPAAIAEPTADITDVFAWMSPDAEHVNLVLNVAPFASDEAMFSDAVVYAFHVNSSTGYGEDQTTTMVLCKFADESTIECWAGDEYLTGDPSDEAGIESDSGKLKVFAGLRNDPFFMEYGGFLEVVGTVISVAGDLEFNEAGCPALDADTSAALVGQLQEGPMGVVATDSFAGANVLSLVVQVDKSVVTKGGPLLGVSASTHAAK